MAKNDKNMVQEKPEPEKVEHAKITLAELRKSCANFGVSASTFDGATSDLIGGEYTVEEIKKHINEWKKKEVK